MRVCSLLGRRGGCDVVIAPLLYTLHRRVDVEVMPSGHVYELSGGGERCPTDTPTISAY